MSDCDLPVQTRCWEQGGEFRPCWACRPPVISWWVWTVLGACLSCSKRVPCGWKQEPALVKASPPDGWELAEWLLFSRRFWCTCLGLNDQKASFKKAWLTSPSPGLCILLHCRENFPSGTQPVCLCVGPGWGQERLSSPLSLLSPCL